MATRETRTIGPWRVTQVNNTTTTEPKCQRRGRRYGTALFFGTRQRQRQQQKRAGGESVRPHINKRTERSRPFFLFCVPPPGFSQPLPRVYRMIDP
eukprot:scaffold6331_cov152-Amphora_coffeaeformis.AAC.7